MTNFKNMTRKNQVLLVVLVASIIVLATSFAYFVVQVAAPASTDVNLGSETSEKLIFTPGSELSLAANMTNLAEGGNSLSDTTMSSAKLVASSSGGSASSSYQVYFSINTNDFVYSVGESTPEILLQITDPEGNEITNVDGVERKTVVDSSGTSITGFDVTTKKCVIKIAEDYAISTADSVNGITQEWNINLIFVNLNSNQAPNEGKTFEANLILQQDKLSLATGGSLAAASILEDNGGATAIEAKDPIDYSSLNVLAPEMMDPTTYGMHAMSDNYGTSYYYFGEVSNNWLKFADMYWRIIRINGDGSVRLAYAGTEAPTEAEKVTGNVNNSGISIASDPDFDRINAAAYYLGSYSSFEAENISTGLNRWYNTYLSTYDSQIADNSFCSDGTFTTESTTPGYDQKIYNSLNRVTNKNYTLNCDKDSSFTKSDNVNGNAMLANKVGLITSDELALGYLFTDVDYFAFLTMSPSVSYVSVESGDSTTYSNLAVISYNDVYSFGDSSTYFDKLLGGSDIYPEGHIQPVINLSGDLVLTGTGEYNDPYIPSTYVACSI